nr:MAG TPA: hypothetical protein [Caudoviricetes sp.]
MYGVSDEYKAQVKASTRDWAIRLALSLDSGETYNLTEQDVESGTFTYQESSTCGDTIQVGSTYANSLDFSLINKDGRFNDANLQDATIVARIGLLLSDGTWEYVPLGKFNIYEPGKKLSTISIRSLDNMYKLNAPFANVDIQYPTNILTLMTTICTHCGVSISAQLSSELRALDITLSEIDSGDMTCRDVAGYVGCLIGKNLRFDRLGTLESFWYASTVEVTTNADTRNTSDFNDFAVNITGVELQDSSGTTYWMGNDSLVASLDSNPLIQNDDIAQEVLTTIYNALKSISYRPYTVTYMGDPAIQAGDRVLHTRNSGNLESIVMTSSFSFHGSATLSAVGTTAEQTRQANKSTKQVQQVVAKAREDLNQGLRSLESTMAMQSDLITQALGFYPKIVYDEDGRIKAVYMMSTPNSTPTTLVWAITSGGIGVSHTGIEGPYTSSWTMDDSILANSITANMVKTGILQSVDGTSFYLDLDNGVLRMDASSIALNGKQLGDFISVTYDDQGRPVLRIGWSGNDIQLKLFNDRISFVNVDGTEMAYWTTSSFRLTTLQSFQLGNMKMVAQPSGSVSFVKGDD